MKTLLKMLRHKQIVSKNFNLFISKLREREVMHDVSKYLIDEFEGFQELDSEELFKLYGTEEYKKSIGNNLGIKLHYQRNSHHPENFAQCEIDSAYSFAPIDFMSFTDVLEMVIDWKSACETYNTNFEESLEFSIKRFQPSSKMEYMIRMIAADLYGTKKPSL